MSQRTYHLGDKSLTLLCFARLLTSLSFDYHHRHYCYYNNKTSKLSRQSFITHNNRTRICSADEVMKSSGLDIYNSWPAKLSPVRLRVRGSAGVLCSFPIHSSPFFVSFHLSLYLPSFAFHLSAHSPYLLFSCRILYPSLPFERRWGRWRSRWCLERRWGDADSASPQLILTLFSPYFSFCFHPFSVSFFLLPPFSYVFSFSNHRLFPFPVWGLLFPSFRPLLFPSFIASLLRLLLSTPLFSLRTLLTFHSFFPFALSVPFFPFPPLPFHPCPPFPLCFPPLLYLLSLPLPSSFLRSPPFPVSFPSFLS